MTYDVLIKNGMLVDGTGAPARRGDVGIAGGKIVEVGELKGAAKRTIDTEGLVGLSIRMRTLRRAEGRFPALDCLISGSERFKCSNVWLRFYSACSRVQQFLG